MALYDDLIAAIPDLTLEDFAPVTGTIVLQNDANETGDYIAKWEHPTPLPKPFKVGK